MRHIKIYPVLFVMIASLLALSVALAHQSRMVAGKYEVTLGWFLEPPIVNEPNRFIVQIVDNQKGMTGLENTLKIQLQQPDMSIIDLPLQAGEDAGDYYTALFTPQQEGAYLLTLAGTLDELSISELFRIEPARFRFPNEATTAPQTLEAVQNFRFALPPGANPATNTIETAGAFLPVIIVGLGLLVTLAAVGVVFTRRNKSRTSDDKPYDLS